VSEETGWKKHWSSFRAAAGSFLACLAFAGILLAFDRFLGWPASWVTLGVVLFVAFLVGAFAGNLVARSSLTTGAPLLLAVAVGASTLAFGWPWPKLQFLSAQAEGNIVWFRTEAMFYVWKTATGEAVENIYVGFPVPHVENEIIPRKQSVWTLYWLDEENQAWPQLMGTERGEILANYGLHGKRVKMLEVVKAAHRLTQYGPKLSYELSELYPREMFRVFFFSYTSTDGEYLETVSYNAENKIWENSTVRAELDSVTLQDYGAENRITTMAYFSLKGFDFTVPISVSCWAQLARKVGGKMVEENWVAEYQIIETYSRERIENVSAISIILYPI
jgi:hypothetical protein